MARFHQRAWTGPLLALLSLAAPSLASLRWTPVGISGGGAMFAPAVSPIDPRLMMLNCDMSAAYLSTDGGANWRMLSYRQVRSNTRCKPVFHPVDPRIIYAASGGEGLKISRDRGLSWAPVGKGLPADLQGEIAIDPQNPSFMLVGAGEAVFRSRDAGLTWFRCAGPQGDLLGFHFDRTRPSDPGSCFAGTTQGVWRSDDGGKTWAKKTGGLPLESLNGFAGGSNAKNGTVMLYCTLPRQDQGGTYVGGIYRSSDRGETWEPAMGTGLNLETKAFDEWAMGPVANYYEIVASDAKPSVVYAFNSNTGIPPPRHASAYKSENAGRTWRPVFQADPRFPNCNVQKDYTVVNDGQFYQSVPLGVAGNPNDPDFLLTVDEGRCYLTRDGGKTWICAHTRPSGASWICNGLVVTTAWNYYIDPFQPQRRYICYTDIGFARSQDRDATWSWWGLKGRAPWSNTCYELAFDPKIPGKIWGAFSNIHDIPNDNIISGRHNSKGPGGVCLSLDSGATWTTANAGLPSAPCVSVVLDPASSPSARTLYAGFFGNGVYRSDDGGRTWAARNDGLGSDANRRVCQVKLHRDGTLFALVTALKSNGRFQPDGVGLYRSRDRGEHWERANASEPLLWPKSFAVDPNNSKILYLSAADANGDEEGGLYRSMDGGESWNRLARKRPEHFGAFLSPFHPGWIYMTLCEGAPDAGLWLSRDDGRTWTALNGLPFANAQRVTFDPADPRVLYVSAFGGGVWRGVDSSPAASGASSRSGP
jgi:photosystem II stability/assembly factor-like uncharacterized protein